jgi:hypothetical protein
VAEAVGVIRLVLETGECFFFPGQFIESIVGPNPQDAAGVLEYRPDAVVTETVGVIRLVPEVSEYSLLYF